MAPPQGASKAQVRAWTSRSPGCEEVTSSTRRYQRRPSGQLGLPLLPGVKEASLLVPTGVAVRGGLVGSQAFPTASKGIPPPPLGSVEVRWRTVRKEQGSPVSPGQGGTSGGQANSQNSHATRAQQ